MNHQGRMAWSLLLLWIFMIADCVKAFAPSVSTATAIVGPGGTTSQRQRHHDHHHRSSLAALSVPEIHHAVANVVESASSTFWLSEATAISISTAESAVDATTAAAPPLFSNQATIAIFVVGLVPFGVATVEFWRRIAVGDSFGTGSDSVVFSIGEDDAPLSSRGRRVLGKGAMATAYMLFAVAATVLGLVLYAVLSSGTAPEVLAKNMVLPSDGGSSIASP